MKRIILAVVLLSCVVAASIFSLLHQTKHINELIENLDAIQMAYNEKDMERCMELSKQFEKNFTDKTQYFSYFFDHQDMNNIAEYAMTLSTVLKYDAEQHFPCELEKCRTQLKKFRDQEYPFLKNIL